MNDFAKALNEVKKDASPAKRKSSMPLLDNAPDEVKTAVDDLVSAKERIKKDEAIVSKSEVVIDDYVKPIQDQDGFDMSYKTSYEVAGHNESVKRVTQDRFTVSNEDEESLREIYGDDFDNMFEKDKTLEAVKDIFTDEELQNEVMKKLGKDLFARLFVYKEKLKTKKGYNVLQYKNGVRTLSDARVFVKQYKAAFKV